MADVDQLLDQYMAQERTVILAVISSSVDIATVDILERASKADKEGVRTIGVLTKPDLQRAAGGGDAGAAQQPQAAQARLPDGEEPEPGEINEGLSLADARKEEPKFFKAHKIIGQTYAKAPYAFGVENLMDRLTTVLVDRIKDGLPGMRKELGELKAETTQLLEEMGKPPPSDPAEIRETVLRVAQNVSNAIKEAESGNYTCELFKDEMRLMARLRDDDGPQALFRNAIFESKPTDEWEIDALRKMISSMRAASCPASSTTRCSSCCSSARSRTGRPRHSSSEQTKSIVEEVCDAIVSELAPKYRTLAASMKTIMQG